MSNCPKLIIEHGLLCGFERQSASEDSDWDDDICEDLEQLEGMDENIVLEIPEGVNHISSFAFAACHAITEIAFPSTLKSIGQEAFISCGRITKINIPDNVEQIGPLAFAECYSLREIRLPNALCGRVKDIFGEPDMKRMSEEVCSGKLKVNPRLATVLTTPLKRKWDVAIRWLVGTGDCVGTRQYLALWDQRPVSLERLDAAIDLSISEGQTAITALFMEYKGKHYPPARLEAMRQRETEKALGIRERTDADWKKIYTFREYADGILITRYKEDEAVIQVPAVLKNKPVLGIGGGCRRGFSSGVKEPHRVILPEGLVAIQHETFIFCQKLTEIVIPNTVTIIGDGAFAFCTSLKSVIVPGKVTCIRPLTFLGCKMLTTVQIPDSVTEIYWNAFQRCDSLREVSFPANVSRIDTEDCTDGGFPESTVVVPKGSLTEQTIRNTSIPYRTV